jgi:hypothetical protein
VTELARSKKHHPETELRVSGKLDALSTIDERLSRFERDMDDLWMAIDATNPLGGN